MTAVQGFVDLRTSSIRSGSHTDDSVWPSFTDIMTVVVMIFLMSLVVILLRNVELVKAEQESTRLAHLKASENIQLENAIESLEQRIAEVQLKLQAQMLMTSQSNEQLEQSQENVTVLMAEIQALQALRNKLQEENTQKAAEILAVKGRLKVVESDKNQLQELKQEIESSRLTLEVEKQQLLIQLEAIASSQEKLQTRFGQQNEKVVTLEQQQRDALARLQSLQKEKQSLSSDMEFQGNEFDALKAVYAMLQQDNRSVSERISEAEQMITSLEQDIVGLEQNLGAAEQTIETQEHQIVEVQEEVQVKQQQLEVAQTEVQEKSEQLVETQEQFSELEEKYLKLVGPARSEHDKYVVKIRYRRQGTNRVIEFQRPDETNMYRVTESELHRRLLQLKKQKGDKLYTRVIIPDDSGLSYDQAWRFTRDILTRYDYYYQ